MNTCMTRLKSIPCQRSEIVACWTAWHTAPYAILPPPPSLSWSHCCDHQWRWWWIVTLRGVLLPQSLTLSWQWVGKPAQWQNIPTKLEWDVHPPPSHPPTPRTTCRCCPAAGPTLKARGAGIGVPITGTQVARLLWSCGGHQLHQRCFSPLKTLMAMMDDGRALAAAAAVAVVATEVLLSIAPSPVALATHRCALLYPSPNRSNATPPPPPPQGSGYCTLSASCFHQSWPRGVNLASSLVVIIRPSPYKADAMAREGVVISFPWQLVTWEGECGNAWCGKIAKRDVCKFCCCFVSLVWKAANVFFKKFIIPMTLIVTLW